MNARTQSQISVDIVVPCYNEEITLPESLPVILEYFRAKHSLPNEKISHFRIILIDDGSADGTWKLMSEYSSANPEVFGVKLSRNYGHQTAMLAGLTVSDADVIITMDADLQDDIAAIDRMLSAFRSGADMALGVRSDRSSDSFFKRIFANAYYKLHSVMGVKTIPNHADFRLMSRRALDALLEFGEVNLFLRGLIPTLGFEVQQVPYVRQQRVSGETKYSARKMLNLAVDGITSFSVAPLRMIAVAGFLLFAFSIICGIYFLYQRLMFPERTIAGWASTVLPLLFLGGFQILSVGIVGEYIGKIYMETKRRPRFFVQETTAKN